MITTAIVRIYINLRQKILLTNRDNIDNITEKKRQISLITQLVFQFVLSHGNQGVLDKTAIKLQETVRKFFRCCKFFV